jgi:hypothetical protein
MEQAKKEPRVDCAASDQQEPAPALDIVWGAIGIAHVIKRTPSQVHYMLARGRIKAARRVGGRYYADVAGLRTQFCSPAGQGAA